MKRAGRKSMQALPRPRRQTRLADMTLEELIRYGSPRPGRHLTPGERQQMAAIEAELFGRFGCERS